MKEQINQILDFMIENEKWYRESYNLILIDAMSRREEYIIKQLLGEDEWILNALWNQVEYEMEYGSDTRNLFVINLILLMRLKKIK